MRVVSQHLFRVSCGLKLSGGIERSITVVEGGDCGGCFKQMTRQQN
jgi:hypothetical protein